MARITVEDCIDKFKSRFELVLVASNRARKLHAGESPTVEIDNDKNTVIALREIAEESIPIDEMKNSLVEEYQTVSAIDEEELSIEYSETEESQKLSNTENTEDTEINEPGIDIKEEMSEDAKEEISEDEENKFVEEELDSNLETNIS